MIPSAHRPVKRGGTLGIGIGTLVAMEPVESVGREIGHGRITHGVGRRPVDETNG
jgi:hypothetical protein